VHCGTFNPTEIRSQAKLCNGQTFHNPVMEELPTTQELAVS
jgi:hypothetical protein